MSLTLVADATAPSLMTLLETPLAALLPTLRDPLVTEIMINDGGRRIYVESRGVVQLLDGVTLTTFDLMTAIESIAGAYSRHLAMGRDVILEVKFLGGMRLAALLPPCARTGPILTIRRHPAVPFAVHDLVGFGTLTIAQAQWLTKQVRDRRTVLFAGSTGVGKTTFINAFVHAIPLTDRLAVIEDTAELMLPHENLLPCEARPARPDLGLPAVGLADLLHHILRHRPDRILLGEVRTPIDASALLEVLTSGHVGGFTTLHANDATGALDRLAHLVMTHGGLTERSARETIGRAIQVVVHLDRRGAARVVTELATVQGYHAASGTWTITPWTDRAA